MGIFDFIHNKTGEQGTEILTAEESFIDCAEKTASLVSDSVENGEIEEVSGRVQEFISTMPEKQKIIFASPSDTPWVAAIAVCILLSVGFLMFFPIALGVLRYSDTYRQSGIVLILLIVGVNAYICRKAILEIRFSKRYKMYENVLRYKNFEIVDDLAEMVGVSKDITIKDLKKAVHLKLIPQGRFGNDQLFFMVTDYAFEKYAANPEIYDRYFRQLMDERSRINERPKEIEDLLRQGREHVAKICDYNDAIKDKDVSEKLDRMEKLVAAIFHEVDINPSQAGKLSMFMNYYLPTTEKLLEAYADIDEKQIKGERLKKLQMDIVQALDSINDAFDILLERFYEEQEIDIASDISVMERVMKQRGDVKEQIT